MADGDEDDDDDDADDGDDGEDEDQEDGDHQGDIADDSRIQDEEMTDVVEEPKPPITGNTDVDATDGIMQTEVVPPSPLTFAPPLASLATGSPRPEGSPLKNVMLQSPTEAQAQEALLPAADDAPVSVPEPTAILGMASAPSLFMEQSLAAHNVESMTVEPTSVVAADEETAPAAHAAALIGEAPTEETPKIEEVSEQDQTEAIPKASSPQKIPSPDVASREETLLPPPPEQVGNISSPKEDDGQDRVSDNEDKSREGHRHPEFASVSDRPLLHPQDCVMTEDTIKPEDSASVGFPLTESGAPSEIGTASVEDSKDLTTAAVAESIEEQPGEQPGEHLAPQEDFPVAEAKEGTPLVNNAQPELENPEEMEVSREDASKEATSPKPDPIITDAPEAEVSHPVPEPEPMLQAKEPTTPTPLPVSHEEPVTAPEEPKEASHEEATAQEADAPLEKPKAEEPVVEQTEPVKEEPKNEVKDALIQEPTVEPASEPTPVDIPAEVPKAPTPPAAEPPAEGEETKEDQPANA